MNTKNWNELTSAYGSKFTPHIAAERNVLAAVVDLHESSIAFDEIIDGRLTPVENDASAPPPAICATADVWFRNNALAYPNGGKALAWANTGTLGTPIVQATSGLQPVVRRDGIYQQPFADFAGTSALQANIPRSFPCSIYTVVKTGFPTTTAMSPWSTNAVGSVISQQRNTFSDLAGQNAAGAGSSWYMTGDGANYVKLPLNVRTAGHWIVMKGILNGPNSVLSINGDPLATKIDNAGTSAAASVRILGSYTTGANYCNVAVKEHIEFAGVLSNEDDAAVMQWLNKRYVKTSQLICDGSSITQGTLGDSVPDSDWPSQILAMLRGNWTVHNLGVQGQDLAAMTADAPTQIDAKINPAAAYKIVVAEGPTNEIYYATGGSKPGTAASIYADYRAYCTARRAAGYQVIATTVMPRTGAGTPPGFEAMRLAFNALLRAGAYSFSDAFVDLAAEPRFQTPADTTYFNDLIHLSPAGLAIFAQLVAGAINRLTDVAGGSGLGQIPSAADLRVNLGLGTSDAQTFGAITGTSLRVTTARTPASATAAGNVGEIAWDASYFYICTATNTWRRTAHASW